MLLVLCSLFAINAQNTVKGTVIISNSEEPLKNVLVNVKGINTYNSTNVTGTFLLNNLPEGKQVVIVSLKGFVTQSFPGKIDEDDSE